MQIIPAVLTNNKDELKEMLEIVEKGEFKTCQVDFIDEEFSNQTLPVALADINKYKATKFDAHLMLSPETIWDEIALAKVNGFKRIIAQVESIDDQARFIEETQEVERGLAVDLESSVDQIHIFESLDVVLLLAVEAGFGGQMMDHRVVEKVKYLVSLREESKSKFRICIDGGVEKEHIQYLDSIGVDEVAVGVSRLLSWHS